MSAETETEVIIVGAGPVGLWLAAMFAAAVYGASEGLRTVVVERRRTLLSPCTPR